MAHVLSGSERAATARDPPCDGCYYRKVRCDRGQPCQACFDAEYACTRNVSRKRKGPKKGSGSTNYKLRRRNGLQSLHGCQTPAASLSLGGESNGLLDTAPTTLSRVQESCVGLSAPGPQRHDYTSANGLLQRVLHWEESSAAEFGWESVMTSIASPPNAFVSATASPESNGRSATTDAAIMLSRASRPSLFLNTNLAGPSDVLSHPPCLSFSQWSQPSFDADAMDYWPELSEHIDLYFSVVYFIWPILYEPTIRKLYEQPEHISQDQKCLLLALCAATVLHVSPSSTADLASQRRAAQRFIKHCQQLRSCYDYIELASISTIQASFFLSCANFELKKSLSSKFYLQEAITLAQGLSYIEQLPSSLSCAERLFHQRTLYFLSLSERGISIFRNKPVTMKRFAFPPEGIIENEDPLVLAGLNGLARVFSVLDESFLSFWNTGSQSHDLAQARQNLLSVQHNLTAITFPPEKFLDIHRADIVITQQWLKLVFWQAAMKQGLLSYEADEPSLSYSFPYEIARSLCAALDTLPISAVMAHGQGIVSPSVPSSSQSSASRLLYAQPSCRPRRSSCDLSDLILLAVRKNI
jgi:hypothetical protein